MVRLFIVLGILLASRLASATENFPPAIAKKLEGPAPECTVCHTSARGGRGTVSTPFGIAMQSRGLVAYEERALETALDALAGEGRDSDADATSDVEELTAGDDPNGGGTTVRPRYGCASAPSAGDKAHNFAVFIAFLLLAISTTRSRRQHPV